VIRGSQAPLAGFRELRSSSPNTVIGAAAAADFSTLYIENIGVPAGYP